MGQPTTDESSPGASKVQRFSIAGGISNNQGDQESLPIRFLMLKNCLVDKRLRAVVKRPGSTTESTAASLGRPLGIGEYVSGFDGVFPVTRLDLINFGGTAFYYHKGGVYTSLSVSSRCSFSTNRLNSFAKLADYMFIAGGLPAKWAGGAGSSADIDRVGIVAPSGTITITSTAVAGAITLTDGAQYMYTYYNSTTGLESDWSTLSANTGAVTAKQIDIAIPAATAANWDKIKIYRTLDGGTRPYLVATVASGTTTYTDNTPDASLTQRADDRYNKGLPPTLSYINAKFASCIWWVDATNPYKLVFSKPYTGTAVDLEYYPVDNYVITNEPITGIFVTPGKLLLFHPRSISQVTGFSADDFAINPFLPGVGTLFPKSISTNGSDITFMAEQGIVSIPIGGGPVKHISREIDLDLQTMLAASYNSEIYVSSCWNPSLRQFIYMMTAFSNAGQPWENVSTFAIEDWVLSSDGTTVDLWETASGISGTTILKIRMWGWSPELSSSQENMWMEYTHPSIPDGGASAFPLFLYHPSPSAETFDPQQDKTWLGYWDGTQGKLITMFRKDKTQDDSTTITSTWMTGRISPGVETEGYKLFQRLGFRNSYSDPTSDSLCTLNYLLDFDDAHTRSFAGSLKSFVAGSTDTKKMTDMSGRFMHLYGVDTSLSQTKILLSEFYIHYRERFRKEGR